RIEPGEVEAQLLACEGVAEAVVLAREDTPGDQRLVAYVVADAEAASAPQPAALRAALSARLAEYMVPSAFVTLGRFPLTANGKLDRRALPAPDMDALAKRAWEAPEGVLETALASLWQDLLGVERVGRHDQFFELGGHSLLAVQLMSRVRHSHGVEVPIRDLFAHPTLAGFAAVVAAARHSELAPIAHADRSRPLPLSWAQQRLWFLDRMDSHASLAYH